MKFRRTYVENLCEGGISRIWQHTHDDVDFAIIGSQDQDTHEDRSSELKSLVDAETRAALRDHRPNGYKWLNGNYTYNTGEHGAELSCMLMYITLDKALEIARKLNQETIIWKDDDFFGIVDVATGKPIDRFSTSPKNLSFDDDSVRQFGSALISKHNKGHGFTFVIEDLIPSHQKLVPRPLCKINIP